MIPEPTPNQRGFLTYGGPYIDTAYGHEIRVQESSAADAPHVWLFISESDQMEGYNPHLTLAQALHLREALNQFIDNVPRRWENGTELLHEAIQEILT